MSVYDFANLESYKGQGLVLHTQTRKVEIPSQYDGHEPKVPLVRGVVDGEDFSEVMYSTSDFMKVMSQHSKTFELYAESCQEGIPAMMVFLSATGRLVTNSDFFRSIEDTLDAPLSEFLPRYAHPCLEWAVLMPLGFDPIQRFRLRFSPRVELETLGQPDSTDGRN